MSKTLTSRLLVGIAFVPSFLASSLATAQVPASTDAASQPAEEPTSTDDAPGYDSTEIVVTGRKRGAELLQDVPATISALSGAQLEQMGVADFTDFAYQIPGLTFTSEGAGEQAYIIRGVRSAGEQQVAVYYDEVPIPGVQNSSSDSAAQTTDLKIFDIDRIEVLKGPQGTTFGANSQVGTVRFIANKPNVNEVEGTVKVGANYTEHGDEGASIYGMANFPLVKDKIALRLVGYIDREGGYVDNVRLGWKDINWTKTTGLRAMLQFRPTEKVTLDLMAWLQDRKNGGESSTHPFDSYGANTIKDNVVPESFFPTGDLVVGDYTYTGRPDKQQIYSATLNWDLDWANLTAAGSYYKRKFDYQFDSTWLLFSLGVRATPPVRRPDLIPATAYQPQDVRQKALEIRLNSKGNGPFQWLGGIFYRTRDSHFETRVTVTDPITGRPFVSGLPFTGPSTAPGAGVPGCQPCVFLRVNDRSIDEISAFGEATYAITDRLELLGGLRWFEAKQKDLGQVLFNFALFTSFIPNPTPGAFDQSKVIKKLQLSYKATDDILFYGLASEGARLGGTNQQGIVAVPVGFLADTLWNYEIGAKTSWADGRVILNLAAFYIDWQDIQVAGRDPTDIFSFVGNAGAAEVQGLEAELTLRPARGLYATAGMSWLPVAKLSEDQVSDSIVALGKKGDRLPNIPRLTLNGSVRYEADLTEGWSGWVSGEGSYQSSSYIEFYPSSKNNRFRRSYGLFNARVGARNEDAGLEVALYMKNIFDARPDISIVKGGGEPTVRITAVPRQIGLEVTKRF